MKNLQALILITLILISALVWAVRPAQAMRRESGPARIVAQPASLEEALNWSLAAGDYRRIEYGW